ncbi:MAG: hypothetical protein OXR73_15320 [Myxococcales bacterium]|nr:hypothetical protein [Myxococcales bacterium]
MFKPPRRSLFVGIAAAAAAVIVLEIGLTRLFSYTIWYHFAYLTISVALLGFGASGSLLAAFPVLRRREGLLSQIALLAQLGVLACLIVISQLPLDPLKLGSDPEQLARVVIYYGVVAWPFLMGGFLVAIPLDRHAEVVGKLYFWDLLGAGVACAAVVPMIWWLGTPATLASSTVLFALAAAAYGPAGSRSRYGALGLALSFVVVGVAGFVEFVPAEAKYIARFRTDPSASLVYHRWTPVNRVDVVRFDPPKTTGSYMEWGISPTYTGGAPGYYMIGNDGDSCAVMYNWDGELESLDFLEHHVLSAPYQILDAPDVLAIGIGGGVDVLNAVKHGARSVVGVELNPKTIYVGQELLSDFNGGILNRPEVEAVAAEGRSFLRSRRQQYDLIEINSVDTLSALSTGAYVLSESYLYTVDAIVDYLNHLRPGGVFAMAVGDFMTPREPARHVIRLSLIVREAIKRLGLKRIGRHVAIIGTEGAYPFTHTLVKDTLFSPRDIEALEDYVEREGLVFYHHPTRKLDRVPSRLLNGSDSAVASFVRGAKHNFAPATDDSPFFFNFYRFGDLLDPDIYHGLDYSRTPATGQIVLGVMLLQSILFSIVLILWPLRRVPKPAGVGRFKRVAFLGYFTALGLGFILLEISFIQRFVLFLGYPTHALTVVMLSLLVSTGLGSLSTVHVSDYASALPRRLAWLVSLVGTYLVVVPQVFDRFLGADFAVRVQLSVALIAPLGLVLGGFFPLGIKLVTAYSPRLVPWAWAVNGCSTVVGTLAAVVMAMQFGFTVVAMTAVSVYVGGVLAMYYACRAGTVARDSEVELADGSGSPA